jgi:hypothetical protein
MSTEPVRDTEPTRITQGESQEWKRGFCDYPASLWTLQYRFRGVGTGFNVTATADGDDFAAGVTTTQTAAMSKGKYEWQAWATNIADTTVIRKIDEGTLIVELGFTSGSTGTVELRSVAKQTLDAIDAALLVAGASTTIEYEITTPAGTHREKKSRTEVLELRKYYARIVASEDQNTSIRNGGKFGKAVKVRMFEQ